MTEQNIKTTPDIKTKAIIEEQFETPLWQKTYDELGLKPTFKIYCATCDLARSVKVEMVMRRSRIHNVADMRVHYGTHTYRPYAFDIAYKCPDCGRYIVFGVAVPTEYALKIKELRGGESDFLLPEEIWSENEQVAKQLAALGYYGGGGTW